MLTLIIIIVAVVLLLGLGAFFFLRRNQVAVEAPPVREVKPKSKPLDAETASKWDKTKREAPLDTGPKRTKPKAQTATPKSPPKDEGKTDPEAAAPTEPETEDAKAEPKGKKAAAAAAAAAAAVAGDALDTDDEIEVIEDDAIAVIEDDGEAAPDEAPEVVEEDVTTEDDADTGVEPEIELDDDAAEEVEEEVDEDLPVAEKPNFRDRLSSVLGGLRGRQIDEDAWEDLEDALIMADVGVDTTQAIIGRVQERAKAEKAKEFDDALALLREEMEIELGDSDITLSVEGQPAIWMFVGVNGVGKTTTIGKLAKRESDAGRSLVLAAGDTFRAAAAEQLETWAERSDAGFVRGAEGADPGSVVFDAVEHAAAKNADLVLADTAGRLHNKANLMEELRKVRRVAEKAQGIVSEVLLVIDATTGQNGMVQAKQFAEAVEVTGIVLTKLDGSAKGGIVLAIQRELGIPVKLVGLGEGIEDLVEFDAEQFVDALFA